MKKQLLRVWLTVVCVGWLGIMGNARAEMGNADVMRTPDHIDFALMFNHTLDDSNGVKDGMGVWIGYRHSLMEYFSIGGKLGGHVYWIENGNAKDQVVSVPLLLTAQVEKNFDHAFNIFAQVGIGPSFNFISGDVTDAFDLSLDPSLAFDLAFGGTYAVNPNLAIGLTFDWFISEAGVNSGNPFSDNDIDISHFGFGILLVSSF